MIETERLLLYPLSAGQLNLLANNIKSLETELRCSYRGEPIEGELLNIVKGQIPLIELDEANYIYLSFWLIMRKDDRTVIGSVCFKNLPDANGEIEIGYGLASEFESKGYMTEAVQAFCRWALEQESISSVIAETDTCNLKSHGVLQRCGFEVYKTEEAIWWRL